MSSSRPALTTTPDELQALRAEFRTMGSGRFDLVKDEESGIAILTINNFAKRNSLSGFMMAQMDEVLTELESWSQVCARVSCPRLVTFTHLPHLVSTCARRAKL